jgi:hypothetical protein
VICFKVAAAEILMTNGLLAGYTGNVCQLFLRAGPYRFFFYSADRDEPLHVHAEREESDAKFRLEPVRLERSRGFGRAEIARVQRLVEENAILLARAWHEYFGN